jgi:hypothetical protein
LPDDRADTLRFSSFGDKAFLGFALLPLGFLSEECEDELKAFRASSRLPQA